MDEGVVTEAEELLYERVASHIEALVARGTLRPGDRIPSVRKLARQQGVSVATVLAAYVHLEDRGVIEARPQSGHYVRARRAKVLPEPRVARPCNAASKVSVGDLIARLYGASRDPSIVQLGAAYLSPELLPTQRINRTLAAVARTAEGLGVSYDPPPGLLALRRQIARRSVEHGLSLGPEDIVTTIGATEAIHVCLRAVTRSGDTVAVESPVFYGLLQLVASLGVRVLEIPAHPRTGMDLDALEDALSRHRIKAVLAIPNFNNPLGSVMPDEAKERLVAMLGKREIPLVEDDVYGDLYFGDARPRPAKAFDTRGLVMLCGSFSKTIAPGYRVGWAAPGRFRAEVEQLKFAVSLGSPTLPQMAVAAMLEEGGYDHHVRSLRRKLAAQVEQTIEAVSEFFPRGTRVSRPSGGFVLWVELPHGTSALTLFERALERGIAVAPGPLFAAKQQKFSSYVRISCGNPYTPLVEHGLRALGRIAAEIDGG